MRRIVYIGRIDDLGVMVEKYDFLGAERHFAPELAQTSGVIRIDDDPEIARIPKFNLAGAEEDCAFGIQELVSFRDLIRIVHAARFAGTLKIMEQGGFSTQSVAVRQLVRRN